MFLIIINIKLVEKKPLILANKYYYIVNNLFY